MDVFKQECKLCENIITDENFNVIEDVIKSMFAVILLELTLYDDTQNVICTMCSSKLLAAFNFKLTCLDRDRSIIRYIDFENLRPVDLREIYVKEMGSKQGSSMLHDREVCRLCLQPMSDDHRSIEELPIDSIRIYIPEVNFTLTTNPVICINCHDALCVHSTFIRNCLEVEKNRNVVIMNGVDILLNDPSIKVEEIEVKCEREGTEEWDTSLYFSNDLIGTEDIKSLYCFDDLKHETTSESRITGHEFRHENNSEIQVYENKNQLKSRNKSSKMITYQCERCIYHTKCKDSFKRHQGMHKAPSEVKVYKYDGCTFEIKRLEQRCLTQFVKCDACDPKSTQKTHQVFECESIRKDHLKQHQLKHKDPLEVQMFECDECDYKSNLKYKLRRHEVIHKAPSEVKMYACDACDYRSVTKSTLTRHQLLHKNPSEVQMHKCGECEYVSIRKQNLTKHQLVHKDPSQVVMYKCDKCDYRNIRKYHLKQHQLRHKDPSEVRMFECDQCDYKSGIKAHVTQHQLTHKDPSDMPVYKCEECDYKCIRKGGLKRHRSIHRGSSEAQVEEFDYNGVKSQKTTQ